MLVKLRAENLHGPRADRKLVISFGLRVKLRAFGRSHWHAHKIGLWSSAFDFSLSSESECGTTFGGGLVELLIDLELVWLIDLSLVDIWNFYSHRYSSLSIRFMYPEIQTTSIL